MRAVFLLLLPAFALAVTVGDINQAITELGASTYAARQAGVEHLVKLAADDHQAVLQECLQAYKEAADPEVKVRLRTALQLIVDKYLYHYPRGFLGIKIGNPNIVIQGGGQIIINNVKLTAGSVWVGGVIENTAAQKAGLQANDVIVGVDGKTDLKVAEFVQYIAAKQPGDHVKMDVIRGGDTNVDDVVLGDLPDEQRQQIMGPSADYFQKWFKEQLASKPPAPAEPAKK